MQIYIQTTDKQILVRPIEAFINKKNYEVLCLAVDNLQNMDVRLCQGSMAIVVKEVKKVFVLKYV